MNILAPVSTLMTLDLITVNASDSLLVVKEKFDQKKMHHLPVVEYKRIVGMISKTDLLYFLKGIRVDETKTDYVNEARLTQFRAEDIMTTRLAKLEPADSIATALDVFKVNLFHALPVVDNDELVGILTTYDIISALANEEIALKDYGSMN